MSKQSLKRPWSYFFLSTTLALSALGASLSRAGDADALGTRLMQIEIKAENRAQVCQQLKEDLRLASEGRLNGECIANSVANTQGFIGRITYEERSKSELLLRIDPFEHIDSTDNFPLGWNLSTSDPLGRRRVIFAILRNWDSFVTNKIEIRQLLTDVAIHDSQRVAVDANGRYVDLKTGKHLVSEEAYELIQQESDKQKHLLRAGLQIAAGLTVGTIQYYLNKSNQMDWDYPFSTKPLKEKLMGRGFQFDPNNRYVNRDHAFAGMAYYLTARNNNLSALQSFLFAFAGSAVWETFSEFREVFSINDQIVTGIGGSIIGEALYQLGRYVAHGPDGTIRRFISAAFQGTEHFLAWLEGHQYNRKQLVAEGFDPSISGRLDFYAGLDRVRSTGKASISGMRIGLEAEINNIPMLEEPGQVRQVVTDTAFARVFAEVTQGQNGMNEFVFQTKTMWAAYHQKNLELDERDRLRGYSFFVGPSSAVTYRDNYSEPTAGEFLTAVNVIGSTVDAVYHINGVRLRVVMDVFGDFAMVRSWAIDRYMEQHGRDGIPSILEHEGYYHGLGMTGALGLSASLGRFELGGRYSRSEYEQIKARQHFGPRMSAQVGDGLEQLEVWVGYQAGRRAKFRASLKHVNRTSDVGDIREEREEERLMFQLISTF